MYEFKNGDPWEGPNERDQAIMRLRHNRDRIVAPLPKPSPGTSRGRLLAAVERAKRRGSS